LTEPVPTSAPPEPHVVAPPDLAGEPYRACELAPAGEGASAILDEAAGEVLRDRLAKLVAAEGPIHVEVALRRVAECFALPKLSARARQRIEAAITELAAKGGAALHDDFLWQPASDPAAYQGFRRPEGGESRELEHIAPEEIANAGRVILAQSLSIAEDEWVRETARLFGVQRVGKHAVAQVRRGLEQILAARECHREGDRIVLSGAAASAAAGPPATVRTSS
jgi:hypothetical protein